MLGREKFFLFDAGVYRSLRPRGPLDVPEEIDGAALETLVMQELRATNANLALGYELHYWHTRDHHEVDFVLYGERGLHAFEVKRSSTLRHEDRKGLELFRQDYPEAKCTLLYTGDRDYHFEGIEVLPLALALPELGRILE